MKQEPYSANDNDADTDDAGDVDDEKRQQLCLPTNQDGERFGLKRTLTYKKNKTRKSRETNGNNNNNNIRTKYQTKFNH